MTRAIFKLQGGLGNQLFIYFGAAMYARSMNQELITFEISGLFNAGVSRPLLLQNFDLPIPFSAIRNQDPKIVGRIKNLGAKYFAVLSTELGYLRLKEVGFDTSYIQSGAREISGYFQSWKYFDSVKKDFPKLTECLKVTTKSEWSNRLISEIERIDPIVCHIRRGDYTDLKNTFGMLNYDYYEGAFEKLRKKGCAGPIWVFTDSPELISLDFLKKNSAALVEAPKDLPDLETFAVMQSASNHVISNSSFSWWAAYSLNARNVVAPSKWFKGMSDPNEIIPTQWETQESTWV